MGVRIIWACFRDVRFSKRNLINNQQYSVLLSLMVKGFFILILHQWTRPVCYLRSDFQRFVQVQIHLCARLIAQVVCYLGSEITNVFVMRARVCACVCERACVYVYVSVHTHKYAHTHTHPLTHTHTHTVYSEDAFRTRSVYSNSYRDPCMLPSVCNKHLLAR